MFERARVKFNVKFREVSVTLTFTRDLPYITPILFTRVKNTRQRKSTLTYKLMFIFAINQPSITSSSQWLQLRSWEKTILSIYFNSICPYCIMYKVDLEESSGEGTSKELMSHTRQSTGIKAIRHFFLQIVPHFAPVWSTLHKNAVTIFPGTCNNTTKNVAILGPKRLHCITEKMLGNLDFTSSEDWLPLIFLRAPFCSWF